MKRTNTESLTKILRAMYGKPIATVNDLVSMTDLSVQTVNICVNMLYQDHILQELTGNRRNRNFALFEYINVFR